MRKIIPSILVIAAFTYACRKSETAPATQIDWNKLADKDWYSSIRSGSSLPPLLTVRYNSNDSATRIDCVWLLEPYKFVTFKGTWEHRADSVFVHEEYLGYRFKVFSLTDSVLITNNWVVGGPGISDTAKIYFYAY